MSEYVPKPDLEGINSPEKASPLKDIAILLTGFLGVVTILFFILTFVSDWFFTRLSLETEIKYLGKIGDIKGVIQKLPRELEDINRRFREDLGLPIQIGVICTKELNAFALPGGRIYLTSALLEELHTENGLMFVLGHEVGHVVNRDHVKGVGRQIVFSFLSSLMGITDLSGVSLMSQLVARSYSRDQEHAADKVGLQQVRKLYGHTWGSEEFFEALLRQQGLTQSKWVSFASTHPASEDRINYIKSTQEGERQDSVRPDRPMKEWLAEMGCVH